MKSEGGLIVSLSAELTSYFKDHPEDLPSSVDAESLTIKCSSYLIEHIEDYTSKPFTDKFLWSLVFPNSKLPAFEYSYFITYKAIYGGKCGIVEARLVYEKKSVPPPSYLYN